MIIIIIIISVDHDQFCFSFLALITVTDMGSNNGVACNTVKHSLVIGNISLPLLYISPRPAKIYGHMVHILEI